MIRKKDKDLFNVTIVLNDDKLIGAHNNFSYHMFCMNVRQDDKEILTNIIVGFMKKYMEIWYLGDLNETCQGILRILKTSIFLDEVKFKP